MINVLCTSYLSGKARSGVSTYTRNLGRYFEQDPAIRITFATVDDTPPFWARIAGLARRVISGLSFGNNDLIEYSFEVKNRLLIYFALFKFRKKKFDVIHAQDILSGHVAKRFFADRVPLVLTCHFNDSPVEEDLLRYRMKADSRIYLERRYRRKFSRVDEFVFVAAYTIGSVKYLLPDDASTTVIYNGLDLSKAPVKINNGPVFSILNTGHVEDRKNQKLFIPIAKELIRRGFTNFRIDIVGHGPALDDLQDSVSEEGLEGHFFFAGWSDNIPAWLATADLYIHTALNDVCPYSVVEAIAARVPVLALRVGGLPEILPQKYLFEVNDHAGLVSCLMDNGSRLAEMASDQLDNISEEFSYHTQVEKLSAVYSRAAGNRSFGNSNPTPVIQLSKWHSHDQEIVTNTEKESEQA
jgi:glycosyltransferase involved in cell wall biosynthesis